MVTHRHPNQAWAFASVQAGKSLLWGGTDALTLYVLVRILHLPPDVAGAAFFAGSIFSACGDGAVGAILARSTLALRMLPFLVGMAIPISVISFALIPSLPVGSDFAGAAVLLAIARGTYSLVDVSHNGLSGRLAETLGHLSLARIRAISTSAGVILIAGLSVPLFAMPGDGGLAASLLFGGVALTALLLMTPLPFLLRAAPRGERVDAVSFAISPALLRLCLTIVLGLAAVGAMQKALPHLQFTATDLVLGALLIPTLTRLAGVWVWSPFARRAGNDRALAIALFACGATSMLASSLIGSGTVGAVIVMAAFGLCYGGVAMILWAVLSERIHAAGLAANTGQQAGVYGLFTMAGKIGLGLSGLLVSGWLSLAGQETVQPAALAPLATVAALGCAAAAIGVFPWRSRRRAIA